jgi:hypothetical protein
MCDTAIRPRSFITRFIPWLIWVIEDGGSTGWSSLSNTEYCDLYQHRDGIGTPYPRISGWKSGRKLSVDTSKYSLHGMVSAFRWDGLITDRPMISPPFMDILFNPDNATKLAAPANATLPIA